MESVKKFTSPRCTGVLTSGNPCLRKRQQGDFCMYHYKANQHITLHLIEVNGVLHFVDEHNNLYDSEAIIMQRPNPQIIGQGSKVGDHMMMV